MELRTRLALLAGFLFLLGGMAVAQQPRLSSREPADLGIAMRAKLSASQRVVEGLTAANFELIHKGAEELTNICQSSVWQSRDDQVYTHYRGELQRAAIKLGEMAEQQNLDGAAYTYMNTLTTCINCHQYSRDVLRVATLPRDAGGVISIPVTDEAQQVYQRPMIR
jgi:cytochrome c553